VLTVLSDARRMLRHGRSQGADRLDSPDLKSCTLAATSYYSYAVAL
jgi:hypothetical protein